MAQGVFEPAKVIVAIDFGTTYSGFSYAHMQYAENDADSFIDDVEGFEQWPSQNIAGAKAYCKTQTSLLYAQRDSRPGEFELLAWGWTAFHQHLEHLESLKQRKKSPAAKPESKTLHFIKNFKLSLAGPRTYDADLNNLPEGLTTQRVVSDYLQQLSILITEELQKKYGQHVDKKDIQWCLTVPAIWDHAAKQEMKKCAEIAGLVAGSLNVHDNASAHPIIIVLEPEAASVYCLHHLKRCHNTDLPPGSKILVVDAGGGTVDLTLHEKVGHDLQVKEISASSGDLCGATFVDDAFYKFLAKKISCYEEFIKENPAAENMIRQNWEPIKFSFDGSPGPYEFWLPGRLSNYWESYEKRLEESSPETNYDDIKITLDEMRSIFDLAVDRIIDLITDQLGQVLPDEEESISMMVVGGFSDSPYLMNRIRENFESRVKVIINPIHPGKAVVTGAAVYGGLGKEIVISRISRKTYGVTYYRDFHPNDPESKMIRTENGRPKCKDAFHIYARKGNPIPVNYCHTMQYTPWTRGHGEGGPGMDHDFISIEVYSTTNEDPNFVTDPGCVKECTYSFPIPSRDVMTEVPRIEISMYFGRAAIEVTAVGLNFESEKAILPELTFETEG